MLLDAIGYLRPIISTVDGVTKSVNQVQPESTQMWLKIIFFRDPLRLSWYLGILIALKFRITPTTHAILTTEIERLRESG